MTGNLVGRTALVTGCLGGIGSETCRLLAEAGATVIGCDLAADSGDWLGEYASRCAYRPLDVTSEEGWNTLAEEIAIQHGALDILVNNAGMVLIDKLEDTSLNDWRKVMAVNVEGAFLGTKACLDLMRRTGETRPFGTSIVNISSINGIVGAPLITCYSASKGAVRLFTKSVALEFASSRYRIRVNSVHPGVVETPMVEYILERHVEDGRFADVEQARAHTRRPMFGRTALPNDIGKAVRFLASDESGYMNGTELVVDGGFTAR